MKRSVSGIAALCLAVTAEAATFNVTSLADSGPGTLREAVGQANASAGADTITFSVTGTITLTSGFLVITGPVTIQGPGAANLAIDGNAQAPVFVVSDSPFGACPNPSGPSDYLVTVSGLTLRNGSSTADGGAIQSFHSLTLDGVVVRDSRAKVGGGVLFAAQYANQSLTIANSQLVDNRAFEPAGSVGSVAGAAVAVREHCVSPRPLPIQVSITNTLVAGNRVQPTTLNGRGGGLFVTALADVVVSDSRIVDNHVDAATSPAPGTSQRGGAVASTARLLRLERTEIAGNSAVGNSAFVVQNLDPTLQGPGDKASVRFVNTTVAGNIATFGGSSALILGNVAAEFYNTTYAHNVPMTGGGGSAGLYMSAIGGLTPPTLKLESSILFNPLEGGLDIGVDPSIGAGLDVTANRSVIGKIDAYNGVVNFVGGGSGNLLGLDPVLGPLAFNGGTTRTLPLLTASPAIDAGSNVLGLSTDQRSGAYARVQGTGADIGAFEYPASCAGLTDVDFAGPFCASASWIKNRDVTQGCGAGVYCPSGDVSRLAMAAFMKRLGGALTGGVVGVQDTPGPLDPDAGPDPVFACILGVGGEIPAAKYPRRVHLDGVLNGIASGTTGLQVGLVGAFDWGGGGLQSIATARGTFAANRWSQVHVLGHVDVPAGEPLAVAMIVSRGGLPGTATLTDSSCKLRARIESRDGTSPPFDRVPR